MFANSQDTILLHGTLSSVHSMLSQEPNLDETECQLNLEGVIIVSSFVDKITHDISKVNTEMEFLKQQLYLNKRFHSAVFFVALKTSGITCAEASSYYDSIAYTFPSLDLKAYLKMNFLCKWSEYFIECAIQLPADVLSAVIKALLHTLNENDEDLKYYVWHISLQSIIFKFFHFEDPSVIKSSADCKFDFPFDYPSNIPVTTTDIVFSENPPKSKLLHAYITILNNMIEFSKSNPTSPQFARVVLHFYKTTFKLLTNVSQLSGDTVKELFRMNVLLKCATVDSSVIESTMKPSYLDHCYATTSWEICGSYLTFLVCNYWKDVEAMLKGGDARLCALSSLLPLSSDIDMISNMCPLFKSPVCEDDPVLGILKSILCYDYPCASRAAGILLMHPDVRSSKDIIDMLKKHASKLSPSETYPLLIDAVVKARSAGVKDTYLELFYQSLSQSSDNLYNDALKYILSHYGKNEHFKLPTTNSSLVQFTRKTMLLDEAEKFLLPLFIQLPQVVLKIVIEQALIRGAEGIAIIPVLKKIPSVCYHKDNIPLVNQLAYYFSKSELETCEEKNIVNLIQSVMEVHIEEEIIPFDKFLELCILPSFTQNIRVDFVLECLNASLRVLTNKTTLNISDDSFFSLIDCLTCITNSCIVAGNGKRKELVLLTLSLLKNDENLIGKMSKRDSSLKYLSSLDEVVHVYFKAFYGKKLFHDVLKSYGGKTHIEVFWTYCCNSKDLKTEFKKRFSNVKISFDQLLSILVELLSHFTKDEWIQSAYVLKEYFDHYSSKDCNLSSLLPKSDPEKYAIIRTLMDCYSSIVQLCSCDIQYVTSCFTNTLMAVLNEESHPQELLNTFLDACHLTSESKTDTLQLLSPLLLSISKRISICKDKSQRDNCLKIALLGVARLPDSDAKSSLLQKLQ